MGQSRRTCRWGCLKDAQLFHETPLFPGDQTRGAPSIDAIPTARLGQRLSYTCRLPATLKGREGSEGWEQGVLWTHRGHVTPTPTAIDPPHLLALNGSGTRQGLVYLNSARALRTSLGRYLYSLRPRQGFTLPFLAAPDWSPRALRHHQQGVAVSGQTTPLYEIQQALSVPRSGQYFSTSLYLPPVSRKKQETSCPKR